MTDKDDLIDILSENESELGAMVGNQWEEIAELKAENERLLAQLPEGMKKCTIQFKECSVGHGWLTASNWVDSECPHCKNERLQALTEKAWKQADDANNAGLKSALRIAKLEAKQKILIDALKLIANDETDWPKNLAQNALGRGNY